MGKTCYNCGTENADVERFCHSCGAAIAKTSDLQHAGIQAGVGEERVIWDNGVIRLTTAAVLIGMETDAPDVVPLETINEVRVETKCLVLELHDGDEKHCLLDDPGELAALVNDHMFRGRLAHERTDMGYVPPD